MMATMSVGDQVKVVRAMQTEDGCWIEAGTEGTLMTDAGDGDWLVYIPAKGSPMINEHDLESAS